jgi:hypothetical protein
MTLRPETISIIAFCCREQLCRHVGDLLLLPFGLACAQLEIRALVEKHWPWALAEAAARLTRSEHHRLKRLAPQLPRVGYPI